MKRTPSFLAALTPTATMAYTLVGCAPAPAASPTAQPAAGQSRPLLPLQCCVECCDSQIFNRVITSA